MVVGRAYACEQIETGSGQVSLVPAKVRAPSPTCLAMVFRSSGPAADRASDNGGEEAAHMPNVDKLHRRAVRLYSLVWLPN